VPLISRIRQRAVLTPLSASSVFLMLRPSVSRGLNRHRAPSIAARSSFSSTTSIAAT
jgi:hypothetical protein